MGKIKFYFSVLFLFIVFSFSAFAEEAPAPQSQTESFCYKRFQNDVSWAAVKPSNAVENLKILRRLAFETDNKSENLCKHFTLNLNYSNLEELIFKEKQLFETTGNNVYIFKKPNYEFECRNAKNRSTFSPSEMEIECKLVVKDEKNNFITTGGEKKVLTPFTIVNGKLFPDLSEVLPSGGNDPLYCAILTKTRGYINFNEADVVKTEPLEFMGKEIIDARRAEMKEEAFKNLGYKNSTFTSEYLLAGVLAKKGENITKALSDSLASCFSPPPKEE